MCICCDGFQVESIEKIKQTWQTWKNPSKVKKTATRKIWLLILWKGNALKHLPVQHTDNVTTSCPLHHLAYVQCTTKANQLNLCTFKPKQRTRQIIYVAIVRHCNNSLIYVITFPLNCGFPINDVRHVHKTVSPKAFVYLYQLNCTVSLWVERN